MRTPHGGRLIDTNSQPELLVYTLCGACHLQRIAKYCFGREKSFNAVMACMSCISRASWSLERMSYNTRQLLLQCGSRADGAWILLCGLTWHTLLWKKIVSSDKIMFKESLNRLWRTSGHFRPVAVQFHHLWYHKTTKSST